MGHRTVMSVIPFQHLSTKETKKPGKSPKDSKHKVSPKAKSGKSPKDSKNKVSPKAKSSPKNSTKSSPETSSSKSPTKYAEAKKAFFDESSPYLFVGVDACFWYSETVTMPPRLPLYMSRLLPNQGAAKMSRRSRRLSWSRGGRNPVSGVKFLKGCLLRRWSVDATSRECNIGGFGFGADKQIYIYIFHK